MKPLAFIFFILCLPLFLGAQQTPTSPNTEVPTYTKEELQKINAEAAQRKERSILQAQQQDALKKALHGLSPGSPEYAAAKEKFVAENPAKYEEIKQINAASTAKKTIHKADLLKMPADRRAAIEGQPDKYQIIE